MDIRVESRGKIILVGMGFYGDPFARASAWDEENEIGSLWRRFIAFLGANRGALGERASPGMASYELHISSPEMAKTGRYEVFAGIEVRGLENLPVVCSAKVLPPADYAVFTVRGDEITGDWMGRLYSEIIPDLGRRADESFSFELYDERFKGMDKLSESELDYYIPLVPAAEP